MSKNDYYFYSQQLQKWEEKKKRQGTNYVIEYYLKKYNRLVDNATSTKTANLWKEIKPYKFDQREWDEEMNRKIRSLKRKIQSHKASWQDHMLYDLYRGKDIRKEKYFSFEEEDK